MSGTIVDVFRQDAFSTVALTRAVEKAPYAPSMLGELGIFTPLPIRTKAVGVEERNGVLAIIQTSPRGAPPTSRVTEKRRIRYFDVPRLAHEDTLQFDELTGVRDFGEETALMQVQKEVARRLMGPTGLTMNMETTWERHRLGAVQGILLDADGSTIYNWFTEFGVSQPAEIAFNLTAQTERTLRPLCNQVTRAIARAIGDASTPRTRITALCGDAFWDSFVTHPDVEKTYLNWSAAQDLRRGQAFSAFTFGDIDWVNYRGTDDNSTNSVAISTNEVKFFPVNAPGVFQVAYAPAEFMPWINTPGKPMYVIPIMDRDRSAWWKQEVYSYPLHICTRPEALQRGRRGA